MPTLGSATLIAATRALQLAAGTPGLGGAITPADVLGLLQSVDFAGNQGLDIGSGAGHVRNLTGGLTVTESVLVGPQGLGPASASANADLVLTAKGSGIVRVGTSGPRLATVNDLGSASAAGSTGQLQVNNAGALAGVTVSGDGTMDGTGVLAVAKIAGHTPGAALGPVMSDGNNMVLVAQLPSARQATIDGTLNLGTLATPFQITASTFRVWVNKATSSDTYVILPIAPAVGEEYWIIDDKGDFNSHPLSVNPGSKTIDGASGPAVFNDAFGIVTLVANAAGNWRIT